MTTFYQVRVIVEEVTYSHKSDFPLSTDTVKEMCSELFDTEDHARNLADSLKSASNGLLDF